MAKVRDSREVTIEPIWNRAVKRVVQIWPNGRSGLNSICMDLFFKKSSPKNEHCGNQYFIELASLSLLSDIPDRYLQGDHSGCAKPPVDIKTKVWF